MIAEIHISRPQQNVDLFTATVYIDGQVTFWFSGIPRPKEAERIAIEIAGSMGHIARCRPYYFKLKPRTYDFSLLTEFVLWLQHKGKSLDFTYSEDDERHPINFVDEFLDDYPQGVVQRRSK